MKNILYCLLLLPFVSFGQENLPDWFLDPPVSPDNSCVYLIGISDPGLNRDDATGQATMRAKSLLNEFVQKIDPNYQSLKIEGSATETISKQVVTNKYHSANFETVHNYTTNYNEVIVLVKYSFTEWPKSSTHDSLTIKTLRKFYMIEDGNSIEVMMEMVSKITTSTEAFSTYYSVSQHNNTDSITSYYIAGRNETAPKLDGLDNKYPNQKYDNTKQSTQQHFKETGTAIAPVKNGLWYAFLFSLQEATSKLNSIFETTLNKSSKSFSGSMTIIKSISLNNNSLQLELGGTLFADGFITKTHPEDVDTNIPVSTQKKPNRFALIIGNEDYNSFQQGLNSEVNVDFALNDAATFHQYAIKTLGVPAENAVLLTNARAMDMHKAIDKLSLLAKSMNGKAELIFYYAGHGFPDDNKEAFLIPVDVSGNDLRFALKLKELYSKLTQYPAARVTVILDACFSGGARNQGLVAARAVKVRPKDDALSGNLVVLTASSGDQSSLPYKEKKHGMFTYLLLKKMQETKGEITYEKLFNHLQEQVGVKSLLINSKEQTPQANVSPTLGDEWKGWKVK